MELTRAVGGALLAWFTTAPTAGGQQSRPTLPEADSAWTRGDLARARMLYASIAARDSTQSRAVFRLAQLEPSAERALALYRRYIRLEPQDPWGHMAEGDMLVRLGRLDDALVAYDGAAAIAPDERDVALGRARLFARAGRADAAAEELTAWLVRHPGDGEAWDLLGRSRLRDGRPHAAVDAFERAARLDVGGAAGRARQARALTAPAITPEVHSAGDSDGTRLRFIGATVDMLAADGLRLGVVARHQMIGNGVDDVGAVDARVRAVLLLSSGVETTAEAGAVAYGAPGWTTPQGALRFRARAPNGGASVDLRAEYAPMAYGTELITARAVRSEARAVIEAPAAAFRVRGTARLGRISTPGEPDNGRGVLEAAVILPSGRWHPSLQYRVAGFERAAAAGYFSPERAETAEAGVYAEAGQDGPLSLAADLGTGVQRVRLHGSDSGPWTRVWRAWVQASLSIAPSRSWFVEVEAYDAPFSLQGSGSAGRWRFLSLSSGLRWAM